MTHKSEDSSKLQHSFCNVGFFLPQSILDTSSETPEVSRKIRLGTKSMEPKFMIMMKKSDDFLKFQKRSEITSIDSF